MNGAPEYLRAPDDRPGYRHVDPDNPALDRSPRPRSAVRGSLPRRTSIGRFLRPTKGPKNQVMADKNYDENQS